MEARLDRIDEDETKVRFISVLCRELCAGLDLSSRSTLTALSLIRPIHASLLNNKGESGMTSCMTLACVCVLLGSKVEEECKKSLKDLCKISNRIEAARNRNNFRYTQALLEERKREVKVGEMMALAAIGFIVPSSASVLHPHRFVIWLIEFVIATTEQQKLIAPIAWGYLNDAAMLDLTKERAFDVACAALLLASFELQIELPSSPLPWLEAVGADEGEVERIANQISDFVFTWTCPQWVE